MTNRRRLCLPRLSDEGGFTLAVSMGIMLIASIISVAAFQAARGDISASADDSDRKVAYAAAESGIQWYQAKLTADPDYWQRCHTGVTSGVADPVNQPNATAGARKWRRVSGSGTNVADFSIAVMPVSPATTCSTSSPASMIDPTDGSFKIRSTGRYRGELRTIVVSFSQQRFLNFIYFTDYETLDPSTSGNDPAPCARYRASRDPSCTEIQFASADRVNGPLHTNDDLLYCGSPRFGRLAPNRDVISVSGPAPGLAPNGGGCSGSPSIPNPPLRAAQPSLQMPPTNSELRDLTTPGYGGAGYRLAGTHYIRFNGNGTMTVDRPGAGAGLNPVIVSLPSNGVIYADDAGCSNTEYQIDEDTTFPRTPLAMDYAEGAGCGNVYVSGTVDRPITIGSARDIIVAPTLATTSTTEANQFNPVIAGNSGTPASSDANLIAGVASGPADNTQVAGPVNVGLIANGYVRVYHRVSGFTGGGATLSSGVRNVRIDAAILSLQHSFIVDNWSHGPSPGTLTVHGAIAQRFRGPVGTGSGGGISTGYVKNYIYDNRLRYTSPPHFLNPVDAAWGIGRQSELVPPL